ncbi:MAG: hypothetical protein ABSG56_32540 [Bryobacteraceae bacterium]|jgi:hypothetical protein
MSFDLPIAEQRLKNTARLAHQSMWLLFLIAAGLMIVVRRSAPARTGSIWFLGCAVLAFMFSFALRDFVRKVGHRNTENKIVRDVKVFLETEPAVLVRQHPLAPVKAAASDPADGVPSRSAGFVSLNGGATYRTPTADPVVFDAIPLHESVAVPTQFFAVLLPVMTNC